MILNILKIAISILTQINLKQLEHSHDKYVAVAQLAKASSNPEVVGSSPDGGEKLAVGRTFSGWIVQGL